MHTISNPFFYGGPVPPAHFIGQRAEVDAIFDQIRNRSSTALYGKSGIGKSSILKYLEIPEVWQARELDISKDRMGA